MKGNRGGNNRYFTTTQYSALSTDTTVTIDWHYNNEFMMETTVTHPKVMIPA